MRKKYQNPLLGAALLALAAPAMMAAPAEPLAIEAQQSDATCSGTVIDNTGEPMIGATVRVVGNDKAVAVTDVNGKFTLKNVKVGSTLTVSYIGYNDAKLVWTGQNVNIALQPAASSLDEVVVMGYNTQTRESLTGALSVVKDDKLKDVTTPNLTNMLNGKAAGVYVAQGSGQPGSGAAVVIRGQASLSGSTAPIWIIDGVNVGTSAGDLNPDDVASITLLKDAASTAIYGADGANGVVVVTTKKGSDGTMNVSASVKLGISRLNNGRLEVMNGAELYDYYASMQGADKLATIPMWTPELRNRNFDWWDAATHTGFAQDYHIAISGGTEKLRSYFSLGYYDESGAVKGYNFNKYSFRASTDFRPAKWISIRPTLQGSKRKITDRQRSVTSMYSSMPWDSPYLEDGSFAPHRYSGWWNASSTNYLLDLDYGNYGKNDNYEFNGSFDFDVYITDWLTFSSVNAYRYNTYRYHGYTDPRSSSGEGVEGRISENSQSWTRKSTNQKLLINKTFGDKHKLNGLIAYEYRDYTYNWIEGVGTGFIPGFQILSVTANPETVGGSISQEAVSSYFTKWNYMYDNKYLLDASFRRDGASNLGKRWGNLWSVSAGWVINRESWFDASWVDYLKLRASYGSVGNRPSSLYPQYDLYSVGVKYDGSAGALISVIGNQDLTWERTFTFDVGFDANFFNERLRSSFDFYIKNTDNILYNVPVTGLVGVTSIYRNVGKMRNTGVEFNVGGDIIATKDWTWSMDMNLAHNSNELRELFAQSDGKGGTEVRPVIISDGSGIAGSINRVLEVGQPIDTYYGREWAGVRPEDGKPLWYTTDENGNRVITDSYAKADEVKLGTFNPKVFGAFNTQLRWKDLDLSASFGFSIGGKIYNYSRLEYDSDGAYTDRNQMKLQGDWTRWEKPGDNATHPRAVYNNTDQGNKASSRYLEDSDYLKLRNLTIGYTLPLPANWGVRNFRVSLSAENIFCITKYSGVDPELPASGGTVMGSTGPGVYPSVRRFSLGLNVSL
ncbi:MAG: TonB-dependent receptor [Pseudoflavonifractor sp.]|nr:TonB-dependent receptor [Alloprevotella sp.]MCM1117301.1 TonB-dependent receptor [Pseudoflavonifractor sp.]